MMELGLITPDHEKKGKMLHNDSHKFESTFIGLTIPTNRSVMFGSLSGSKLGIWVAHGEGKFSLPYDEDKYNVVAKYTYDEYPGNPNGSDYSVAAIASTDGRHLASCLTWNAPSSRGRTATIRKTAFTATRYPMDRGICQRTQVGGRKDWKITTCKTVMQ